MARGRLPWLEPENYLALSRRKDAFSEPDLRLPRPNQRIHFGVCDQAFILSWVGGTQAGTDFSCDFLPREELNSGWHVDEDGLGLVLGGVPCLP